MPVSDPAPVEQLLRDAGFREVHSRTHMRTVRYPDGNMFVRLNATALVGMSAGGKELADSRREHLVEQIVRESTGIVAEQTDTEGFSYSIGTNATTALR